MLYDYVIGIDQSYTCTGYTILRTCDSSLVHFGTITTNKMDSIYYRANQVATQLGMICSQYTSAKVAIEGLSFGLKGNATRDLAGLQFSIITHLQYVIGIPDVYIISPTSAKKHATGSGGGKIKVTKQHMIDALPSYVLGKFIESGLKKTKGLADVADSYHIASACISSLSGRSV